MLHYFSCKKVSCVGFDQILKIQNCQKLSKIVKNVKNWQKLTKLSKITKNYKKLSKWHQKWHQKMQKSSAFTGFLGFKIMWNLGVHGRNPRFWEAILMQFLSIFCQFFVNFLSKMMTKNDTQKCRNQGVCHVFSV
jgi:hypothetical protein